MKNTNQNKSYSTPKDVFLHLLNILTFYLSIIGFITLYIQYISVLFPDPLNFYYTMITDVIRVFSSILVIAIPVYILTSWFLGKDLKNNPKKREFKLRKWLLYFTLFVSAVTIIVDLIIAVNHFMSGELTVRFLLKVLVVLLVAAAVFGYYSWDLRRKDKEKSKTPKKLAFILPAVVLASVIWGFFLIGTPAEQRQRRFDEQRISDLQTIQSQIINYWIKKEVLPRKLDDLNDSISGFFVPTDPETKASYVYKVTAPLSFELCATFKTSSKDSTFRGEVVPMYPYYYDSFQQNWEHETGEICFERTIDPELYKTENQLKGITPPVD